VRHSHYNPPLVIAILQAFARVGDENDLAEVERLASGKAALIVKNSLRTAAQRCHTIMKARISGDTHSALSRPNLSPTSESITLSTEAVEFLSSRLSTIARIRRRNVAITAAGAVVGTGLAFLSLRGFPESQATNTALMAGMLSCLASMIFFALSGTYAQRNLTNALIHSNDLQIVPPLIQAAATVEISGTTAVMLLTRLLPRMRASDANLLNADDRTLLHTAMVKHARNRGFVLAALKALQQIGDRASIPTVKRFAERGNRRGADPAIRDAAQECLEFLRQRAALSEANNTLLRASSSGDTPTDILLRAVDSPLPTAPEELLRTTAAPIVYEQIENDDAEKKIQTFAPQPAWKPMF
jgi:hypothetical protein